jgi:acyl-coenzyme A thioesterase PaaI-like protein
MKAKHLRLLMNLWPPLLFAGIRVTRLDDDWRTAEAELRMGRLNRNWVGTHFGGSLFAMTDPFYMLMLLHVLGPGYIVWDKAAAIDFVHPGRGRVTARFHLDAARIDEIREATAGGAKHMPTFTTEITDEVGERIATVERTLYVRRKRRDVPST